MEKAQVCACECSSLSSSWFNRFSNTGTVFLSLAGVKKPPETALTRHHGAVKVSTDTVTNEIVLGGLAAP